jgi:transcriptional regulator with XRE-family HTH domain
MLTVSQLRAARAMTGMTVEELASATGLSVPTITAAEASPGPFADAAVTDRLRGIFEARGVLFLAAGEENAGAGPGLRLRNRFEDEGIRPQNLNAANDG